MLLTMKSMNLELTLDASQFAKAKLSESCQDILVPSFLIKLYVIILNNFEMAAQFAKFCGDKKLCLILKYMELQSAEKQENRRREKNLLSDVILKDLDLTSKADLQLTAELGEIAILQNDNSIQDIFILILRKYQEFFQNLRLETIESLEENVNFIALLNLKDWLSYFLPTVSRLKLKQKTVEIIEECQTSAFFHLLLSNFLKQAENLYKTTNTEGETLKLLEGGTLILSRASHFPFSRTVEDILVSAYVEVGQRGKRKFGSTLSKLIKSPAAKSRFNRVACSIRDDDPDDDEGGLQRLFQRKFSGWKRIFEEKLRGVEVNVEKEELLGRLPRKMINYPTRQEIKSSNNIQLARERDKKGLYRDKSLQINSKIGKTIQRQTTEIEKLLCPDWPEGEILLGNEAEKIVSGLSRWHRRGRLASRQQNIIDIGFLDLLNFLRTRTSSRSERDQHLNDNVIEDNEVEASISTDVELEEDSSLLVEEIIDKEGKESSSELQSTTEIIYEEEEMEQIEEDKNNSNSRENSLSSEACSKAETHCSSVAGALSELNESCSRIPSLCLAGHLYI